MMTDWYEKSMRALQMAGMSKRIQQCCTWPRWRRRHR